MTIFSIVFPGMGFTGKRAGNEDGSDAGVSKLMVGLVSKRKPGMEFLGKRLAVNKIFIILDFLLIT